MESPKLDGRAGEAMKAMNRRSAMKTTLGAVAASPAIIANAQTRRRRNVIFILTDDHRYDAMGFLRGQKFLETPHLDSLARDGVHFQNAFVTTSLCSPSRASILTGMYAHQHKIVDNNTAIPRGTRFFPELLQKAGYATAFIGKWHMGGESDDPQPGFDRWVSFRGQGSYLPSRNGLNIDGKRVPQKGYLTDELTDYAIEWLTGRRKDQPYFLYLSHKAVHGDFVPPERYQGRYAKAEFVPPRTMAPDGSDASGRPMWVRNQRNSWHGVEFSYHADLDVSEYYKRYAETLLGVDDSVGRVLDTLKQRGELDSTLIVYMGDNGFAFGEHGLIDKRTAYEESIRTPMLARCPELAKGGQTAKQVVANIDILPTMLEAGGLEPLKGLPGQSLLPLMRGEKPAWRDSLLYEYYWERNYPQTPTMFALRGDRYKYIHYYGIWDSDELYDLAEDPQETRNLIYRPEIQPIIRDMNRKLFETLEQTGGMSITLYPDRGAQQNLRDPRGSKAADFPPELVRKPVK
jgi:N-acetylglucosamine-6-sulfatase